MSAPDLEEMRGYAERIGRVPDRKVHALEQHLDEARGAGHGAIVFTQFTDTLDSLRDRLHHRYGSQLGTFTGDGGRVFRENEGWVDISKRDLIEAIKARAVTVLLATDAASEGLNLQTCSYLINYDMPWNPMRVEQRIGRVDRLGQVRDTVVVRNFFIEGTVEEEGLPGIGLPHRHVQRHRWRSVAHPRRSRGSLPQRLPGTGQRAGQDTTGTHRQPHWPHESNPGADFRLEVEEDPLPILAEEPSPVTLADLREVVIERFGAVLDQPGRPVTTDPTRVSRDAASWVALATYGHPRLDATLSRFAKLTTDGSLIPFDDGPRDPAVAVRADTVPPRPARRLADVDELGPSVSRSEAESVASDLLDHARRARYSAVEQRNQADTLDKLRTRYTQLVAQIMADAVALTATRERPPSLRCCGSTSRLIQE